MIVPPPETVGAKFVIENNVTGVHLNVESGLFAIGGLTVRNNTYADLKEGTAGMEQGKDPCRIKGSLTRQG